MNMMVLSILRIISKTNTLKKNEQKTECLKEKQRERKCSLYYLVISHKYVIKLTVPKHESPSQNIDNKIIIIIKTAMMKDNNDHFSDLNLLPC